MTFSARHLVVPTDLRFEDLRLALGPGGALRYQPGVLRRVLEANGLTEADAPRAGEKPWALIAAWYAKHLQDMGAPDPVLHPLVYPKTA